MAYTTVERHHGAVGQLVCLTSRLKEDLPLEDQNGDGSVRLVRSYCAARAEADQGESQATLLHQRPRNPPLTAHQLLSSSSHLRIEVERQYVATQPPVHRGHELLLYGVHNWLVDVTGIVINFTVAALVLRGTVL